MSSPIANGITALGVGMIRLPMLFASMNGTLIMGELAFRVAKAALECIGFTGNSGIFLWIRTETPVFIVQSLRPYKERTTQDLLILGAASCVIGILGNAFVTFLFGKPTPLYNTVLTYLGPFRVVGDRHPVVDALIRYNH